jgi:hypothetical protein
VNPFSKLTSIIGYILTLLQGATHDSIVAFLTTGFLHLSAPLASVLAYVALAATGAVSLFGHAVNGNGPPTPATNTDINQPIAAPAIAAAKS